MEKINQIINWAKNYQNWEKKDYIKVAVVAVIVIAAIISIFS
jgi:hypothetical protein|tara:strand:- start:1121 stop:1246 length:126 start_codon:yes stop_codon:yes gene_type:complete